MRVISPLMFAIILAACSSAFVMPERDLNADVWTVWSGQASWKPDRDRPSIAGDILLARHHDGDVYVNFAKSPVGIFTAQTHQGHWQLDLVQRDASHAGRGRPPKRFVWFQLPAVVAGSQALLPPWNVEKKASSEWMIENAKSGETILLFIDDGALE